MAFDDSRVPWLRESGGDSVEVAFQVPGESQEAGQVGVGGSLDPGRKLVSLQLSMHVREGTDVPDEWLQFGAVGQYDLEPEPVALGQGLGTGKDPAGNGASGRRPRADRLGLTT
ncbi:hypothetical protein [Streptomyces sp. NPDC127112]|uniref:hypothetical protein n=1 Tax=Streptomyces sp. NPDC127112 TaxID=3345364 RepID=UPI0036336EB0